MYRSDEDEGLIALSERTWEQTDADLDESLRKPLVALRRADLGSTALKDWLPGGVPELMAQGFVPLENVTGNLEIVDHWPEPHRQWVAETRWNDVDPDGRCWLVRSPWPSLSTHEVIDLPWRWVFGQWLAPSGPARPGDEARRSALMRQFLLADESWVLAFRDGQR